MSDQALPLALRDIKRTFVQGDRRLEVLRGITLDLRSGEIVALVGQSGSGGAEVDFITSMPVRVQPVEVASVIAVAIVLSLAAAAYPAWRSARVEPVEGLRHE